MTEEKKNIKKKNKFSDKLMVFFKKKNIKTNNLGLLESDLIKDEVEIKFDWKKDLIIFAILFSVVFIFAAEAYIFLSVWEKNKEAQYSYYLEDDVIKIKNEISEIQEDYNRALDFNKQLNISSGALKRHIYWSHFFSFLENNTLKNNIYYKNFSGDISGRYVLPSVANEVLAISYQSKVFSSDPMVYSTSISDEEIINDEVLQKTIINFNLNLNLDNKIFN